MKITKTTWPKHLVKSVDCRKKDLVIRITDWTKDKDEPAFDVEAYNKGIYDFNESQSFLTKNANRTKKQARDLAIVFAQQQIQKLICPTQKQKN